MFYKREIYANNFSTISDRLYKINLLKYVAAFNFDDLSNSFELFLKKSL